MRIAILDDYQRVALQTADWASLGATDVVPFHGHIADTADLLRRLNRTREAASAYEIAAGLASNPLEVEFMNGRLTLCELMPGAAIDDVRAKTGAKFVE